MTAHDRGEPVDCVQLGAGLWLAWVIYQDRPAWPWLMDTTVEDAASTGCRCRYCCPHEQNGRLPNRFRPTLPPTHSPAAGVTDE